MVNEGCTEAPRRISGSWRTEPLEPKEQIFFVIFCQYSRPLAACLSGGRGLCRG